MKKIILLLLMVAAIGYTVGNSSLGIVKAGIDKQTTILESV